LIGPSCWSPSARRSPSSTGAKVLGAHESSVNKLMASKVEVKLWYELRTVKGNGKVEEAVIYENHTNQDESLKVDFVIPNFGFLASLDSSRSGPGIGEEQNPSDAAHWKTNVPASTRPGTSAPIPESWILSPPGFPKAPRAVNFARAYMNPSEKAERDIVPASNGPKSADSG